MFQSIINLEHTLTASTLFPFASTERKNGVIFFKLVISGTCICTQVTDSHVTDTMMSWLCACAHLERADRFDNRSVSPTGFAQLLRSSGIRSLGRCDAFGEALECLYGDKANYRRWLNGFSATFWDAWYKFWMDISNVHQTMTKQISQWDPESRIVIIWVLRISMVNAAHVYSCVVWQVRLHEPHCEHWNSHSEKRGLAEERRFDLACNGVAWIESFSLLTACHCCRVKPVAPWPQDQTNKYTCMMYALTITKGLIILGD